MGLAGLIFLAGSANKLDPARNKALARRWIEEGFNRGKLAVVDEIFAEGFVVNGQRVGRQGVRRSMSGFLTAFPDLHVTLDEVLAEGEKVGLWYTAEGTHRGEFQGVAPTERRVKWSGADLLSIVGGKIVEARFLDDSMGLMRQLRDQ
jgi:predicted ester cyclase